MPLWIIIGLALAAIIMVGLALNRALKLADRSFSFLSEEIHEERRRNLHLTSLIASGDWKLQAKFDEVEAKNALELRRMELLDNASEDKEEFLNAVRRSHGAGTKTPLSGISPPPVNPAEIS